jgi:hypothetical protein
VCIDDIHFDDRGLIVPVQITREGEGRIRWGQRERAAEARGRSADLGTANSSSVAVSIS